MTVLAIVGEDATHATLIDGLLRQTLRDAAHSVDRRWLVDALDEATPVLDWRGTEVITLDTHDVRYFERDGAAKALKRQPLGALVIVRGKPIKTHGFVNGRPLGPAAKVWRRALIAVFSDDEIEGVIAAQDTDGTPANLDGLRQVVELFDWPIVICAPHQDAEGWLVLGLGAAERRPAVASALGFCPVREPHRLTASPNHANTDAKRVLRRLLFDDDRSAALTREELAAHLAGCLPNAPTIAAHGSECGIAAFCDGIRDQIAPLFDPALSPR